MKISFGENSENSIDLITTFIKNRNDLDALFFTTNYLCIAGLQSLQRLQMSVPDDMAVLSFDDHDLFAIYPPGITAIHQPMEQIGQAAVELLMHYLPSEKEDLSSKRIFVDGKLNKRGSTEKLSR